MKKLLEYFMHINGINASLIVEVQLQRELAVLLAVGSGLR